MHPSNVHSGYVLTQFIPQDIVGRVRDFQAHPVRESCQVYTSAVYDRMRVGIKVLRQTLTEKYDDFLCYEGYDTDEDLYFQCTILGMLEDWVRAGQRGEASLERTLKRCKSSLNYISVRYEDWWCSYWNHLYVSLMFGGACIHLEARLE